MSNQDLTIRDEISRLVDREHQLRGELGTTSDRGEREADRTELRQIEEALDVCWDLLRQRQALRAAAQDPTTRPYAAQARSRATSNETSTASGR
jgi:hypothetical protein